MSTASILATLLTAAAAQLAGGPEATQIHWQRSLDDALAIAEAEGRPLLLAVNMDGESACERIVREVYKDPAFVERTRGAVCLVSSVFRHTPRDHDDEGARVECPRLGEVTCGEHIALEPLLYDRFLGGDRVAPRHALVTTEGEVVFDLTLLWDFADIARALDGEVQGEAQRMPQSEARSDAALERDHRQRLALEARGHEQLRYERDAWMRRSPGLRPPPLSLAERAGLLAEERVGRDLLRALLPAQPQGELADAWVRHARGDAVRADLASFLRGQLNVLGERVERPHLGERLPALVLLARIDDSTATRTLLRSFDALPGSEVEQAVARRALEPTPAAGTSESDELLFLLPGEAELARRVPYVPWAVEDPLGRAEDYAADLARLEERLTEAPDDPGLVLAMGRAALGLARRRMESGGGSEVPLLLEDALRYLERAHRNDPGDATILLHLARASWSLGRFEEQRRYALAVWELETGGIPIPGGVDEIAKLTPAAVEGLRWLADASGRLLANVSGGDPRGERELLAAGGQAHLAVALSPYADASDWVPLASFFAALGRWADEAWFAYQGLLRYPDDPGLHQALSRSLHAAQRPDLAASTADRVAWERPQSGTAHWYAGLQHFLHADWLRRGEQPARAIATYARAKAAFETSKELVPAFADSADHYLAFAELGRGFAHLLADRQAEAADALVAGIALRPSIATLRDGLDREALDLLDGALEYRRGRPSPVEPLGLLERLEAADPGNAFWPRAVSEACCASRCAPRGASTRRCSRATSCPRSRPAGARSSWTPSPTTGARWRRA